MSNNVFFKLDVIINIIGVDSLVSISKPILVCIFFFYKKNLKSDSDINVSIKILICTSLPPSSKRVAAL